MKWAHTTEVESLRFHRGEHGRKRCKCPPPPPPGVDNVGLLHFRKENLKKKEEIVKIR
jgi:hypothetical protein